MGLFDTIDAQKTDLDPGSQGLLNQAIARASASSGDIAAGQNKGLSEQVGKLDQSDRQINQQSAKFGGGGDPAMLKSIRDAYGMQTQGQVDKIKSQNEIGALQLKSNMLQQITPMVQGQQQAQNEFYQKLTDAYNKAEAGRSQLVGSLFQMGNRMYATNVANGNINKSQDPDFSSLNQGRTQAQVPRGYNSYSDVVDGLA